MERRAVGDGCVDPVQEPDVLVGHEHVHESAQLPRIVEEPVREPRMGPFQRLQNFGHGRALDRHLAAPPGSVRSWAGLGL